MGILDEAIREHLELKRQHGAEESELKGLEDEAFGQAERPDATSPAASAEAETQVISPGSSVTSPAGEGDQLDKVFEATRQREAEAAASAERQADEPEVVAPEPAAEAEPQVTEAATVESAEARPAEPAEPEQPESEGDAGDLLEAERQHLVDHPTEHYDVDAAIAEEDEIDILSESSLSDELDRALEGGEPAPETAAVEPPVVEETDTSGHEAIEEDSAELLYEDAAAEDQPVEDDEPETGEEEPDGSADFFDQEDVLEATPDFLEETPEHDQLWFEQKEPKDFDFGD